MELVEPYHSCIFSFIQYSRHQYEQKVVDLGCSRLHKVIHRQYEQKFFYFGCSRLHKVIHGVLQCGLLGHLEMEE